MANYALFFAIKFYVIGTLDSFYLWFEWALYNLKGFFEFETKKGGRICSGRVRKTTKRSNTVRTVVNTIESEVTEVYWHYNAIMWRPRFTSNCTFEQERRWNGLLVNTVFKTRYGVQMRDDVDATSQLNPMRELPTLYVKYPITYGNVSKMSRQSIQRRWSVGHRWNVFEFIRIIF